MDQILLRNCGWIGYQLVTLIFFLACGSSWLGLAATKVADGPHLLFEVEERAMERNDMALSGFD